MDSFGFVCRHNVAIRMPSGVMYVNIMATVGAVLAPFFTVEEGIAHTVPAGCQVYD